MANKNIKGKVYILDNDINTDQILTAEFMKINPATEEGYEELGSLAMSGLSDNSIPFINKTTGNYCCRNELWLWLFQGTCSNSTRSLWHSCCNCRFFRKNFLP